MADFTPVLLVLGMAAFLQTVAAAVGIALVVAGILKHRKGLWIGGAVLLAVSMVASGACVLLFADV